MRRKNYNTKGRNQILDFLIENNGTSVSIQDILSFLEKDNPTMNRSTVYRYLNQLCSDGIAMKFLDNDEGKTVYQYIGEEQFCQDHLHLKCISCNSIIHLDCGFMEEIKGHLEDGHKFELQCEGSVLYGLCEKCRAEKEKK